MFLECISAKATHSGLLATTLCYMQYEIQQLLGYLHMPLAV
jgi:hypothetical protein